MLPSSALVYTMPLNDDKDLALGVGLRGTPLDSTSILGQGHSVCSSPSPLEFRFTPHIAPTNNNSHPGSTQHQNRQHLTSSPPLTAPVQSPFFHPQELEYKYPLSAFDITSTSSNSLRPPPPSATPLAHSFSTSISMDHTDVAEVRNRLQTRSTGSVSGDLELGFALTTPTTGLLYSTPTEEKTNPSSDNEMDLESGDVGLGKGDGIVHAENSLWTSDCVNKIRTTPDQLPVTGGESEVTEVDKYHYPFASTGLTSSIAAFPDGTTITPISPQPSNPTRPGGPLRTFSAGASLPSRRNRSSTSLSIATAPPVSAPAPASAVPTPVSMRGQLGPAFGMTPSTAYPNLSSYPIYSYPSQSNHYFSTPGGTSQTLDQVGGTPSKRVVHPSPSSVVSTGVSSQGERHLGARTSFEGHETSQSSVSLGLSMSRGVRSANSVNSLGIGPMSTNTVPFAGGRAGDSKTPRFKPTKEQLDVLIATYENNKNPDAPTREMLAKRLGPDIRPKTLQIWFQNRRSKARAKERIESGEMEGLSMNHHSAKRASKSNKEKFIKRSPSDTARGISWRALRKLVHDDDIRLELIPISVVMINSWTRVLTPGSGMTKPDLGVSLHLDSTWSTPGSLSASTSASPTMNTTNDMAGGGSVMTSSSPSNATPKPPSIKVHVIHNDETFRITIPIAAGNIEQVKIIQRALPGPSSSADSNKDCIAAGGTGGTDVGIGASNMSVEANPASLPPQRDQQPKWEASTSRNVAALSFFLLKDKSTFHRWNGEKWVPHGDFTGMCASQGGMCEFSGDPKIINQLFVRIQSLLVSSPFIVSSSSEYFFPAELSTTCTSTNGLPIAPLSASQLYNSSLIHQPAGFAHNPYNVDDLGLGGNEMGNGGGHNRKRSISQPVPMSNGTERAAGVGILPETAKGLDGSFGSQGLMSGGGGLSLTSTSLSSGLEYAPHMWGGVHANIDMGGLTSGGGATSTSTSSSDDGHYQGQSWPFITAHQMPQLTHSAQTYMDPRTPVFKVPTSWGEGTSTDLLSGSAVPTNSVDHLSGPTINNTSSSSQNHQNSLSTYSHNPLVSYSLPTTNSTAFIPGATGQPIGGVDMQMSMSLPISTMPLTVTGSDDYQQIEQGEMGMMGMLGTGMGVGLPMATAMSGSGGVEAYGTKKLGSVLASQYQQHQQHQHQQHQQQQQQRLSVGSVGDPFGMTQQVVGSG